MADATNNIKEPLIKVDLGDAVSNIKEYKKNIEELKGTLLGLKKDSDEYNAVQEQIRDKQEKLNEVLKDTGGLKEYKQYVDNLKGELLNLDHNSKEYEQTAMRLYYAQQELNDVMSIGKDNGEALEGSYNNLSKRMSQLKKEWKATADEAKRADLGRQIKDLNDQLKDLDESVGVYSRNVGNYTNSIIDASKIILSNLGQFGDDLGVIGKDLKNLIPLIQKTTTTATTGLKGIKKALVGLGIGAIVVVLGEIVAHFTEIRRALGLTDEKFQEFKTKTTNVLKTIVAGIVGVGNSILQYLITPFRILIDTAKGVGKIFVDIFKGNFKNIKEDAQKAGEEISNAITKGFSFKANFNAGKEFADQLIQNIEDEVKKKNNSGVKVKVDAELKLKEVDISKFDSYIDKALQARIEAEKKAIKEKEELEKILAEQEKQMYDESLAQLDEYNEEYIKSVIAARQREEQLLAERKQSYFDIAGSIGAILLQVSSMWEDSINAQIEAGKMSEEEGKRQFEKIKALQIAEAIINTIAGAVGAFMGITKDTGGWGIAAAIAQAAAVMAAGMAQVTKIKNTTIDSKSSTNSSPMNLGNVVNDYQPQYVTNVTNQTELSQLANALQEKPIRAYVVEQDISDAQELARSRYNETTF